METRRIRKELVQIYFLQSSNFISRYHASGMNSKPYCLGFLALFPGKLAVNSKSHLCKAVQHKKCDFCSPLASVELNHFFLNVFNFKLKKKKKSVILYQTG